jgi:hypothetical protein
MLFNGCRLLTQSIMDSLKRTNEVYVGFFSLQNIELLENEINTVIENNCKFLGIEVKKS